MTSRINGRNSHNLKKTAKAADMPKIDPASIGLSTKIFVAYMAVLGTIAGLVYSVGGAAYDATHGGLNAGTALAFLALIGMPVASSFIGLLIGLVLAMPVDWLLRRFGGSDLPGK
ncbi:hypothetical protein [Parasphingopyxis sp.]|uniref:hypothetical protein n=1 Tax=Parasphingopyxis sp. TaxID=1920299 RepID=UPI0032ED4EBF